MSNQDKIKALHAAGETAGHALFTADIHGFCIQERCSCGWHGNEFNWKRGQGPNDDPKRPSPGSMALVEAEGLAHLREVIPEAVDSILAQQ